MTKQISGSILFTGMFWRALSIRSWLLGALLIAGLCAFFYLVFVRGTESATIQILLNRQQIIARAEANNVESFFQVFGESIAVLAQLSSMESLGTKTLEDVATFVDQWRESGLVGGVVLTDKNGLVQLNSNVLGTSDIGTSLADRDYFVWAKGEPKEGEYFIGQPIVSLLMATKDQIIVPVAAPVYQNSTFVGVVSATVKLQPLTERYLKLMKVSDDLTEVYLVDQYGKLLYSPVRDAAGSDVSELLGDNIKNALDTNQEGKMRATYSDSKSGKPEDHLIAYSSISLGGQNWLLITSSTYRSVVDLTVPTQILQTAMLILASLSILLFGIIVARENKSQKSL